MTKRRKNLMIPEQKRGKEQIQKEKTVASEEVKEEE